MATETLQIIINSKASGQGSEKASKELRNLKEAAKVAALGFVALKTAQETWKFAEFGAGVQRQAAALDGLAKSAGSSGRETTAAIQGASDYTIDRMTAMGAASKAMMLDVAETPEQFERLTKVASSLGRAMGQDAAKSIDDFVTAAGRQSMQIADNLGLTIKAEVAYERYAKANGKLATELTTTEKKQAFLNEMLVEGERKMADLGETTLDAAGKMEQASAGWADAKASLGSLFASFAEWSGVLDAVSSWAQDTAGATDAIEQHGFSIGAWAKAVGVYVTTLDRTAALETFTQQIEENTAAVTELGPPMEIASVAMNRTADAAILVADATGNSQEVFDQYNVAIASVIEQNDLAAISTVALREAEEEAAIVAGELAQKTTDLQESLKGASAAKIASTAISQLDALLDSGAITAGEYNTAVTETQLAFGLADEASINLTNRLLALNERFGAGTVSASEYDAEMARLIEINNMENLQLEKFGGLLSTTTAATTTVSATTAEYGAQVDLLGTSAQTSASFLEEQRAALAEVDQAALAAEAKFRQFRQAIDEIQSEKTVTIRIREIRETVRQYSPGATVPDITMAGGGVVAQDALALIGEDGPELVNLPAGSQVFDAAETARIMQRAMGGSPRALPSSGLGGGSQVWQQTFIINAAGMDARELADEIKKSQRVQGVRQVA